MACSAASYLEFGDDVRLAEPRLVGDDIVGDRLIWYGNRHCPIGP